jgi:TfoX/Sxy family transcriptional regulator of competence genes
MPFNEDLALRIRAALGSRDGFVERKMFGGIAFMLSGNMCVGVTGDDLMVRVGPGGLDDAMAQPHARPMDFNRKAHERLCLRGPGGNGKRRFP